jgi:hypothetical protein
MLRIVQFKVTFERLLEAAKHSELTVRFIGEQSTWGHPGNDSYLAAENRADWVSEPMATTERRYFEIEQSLRSLFGDRIHWDTEDLTAEYKLLRTRAPQSYDYGYVIEIGVMPGQTERDTERLIAMPKESVEYQSGRYSSGMYTPIDCS